MNILLDTHVLIWAWEISIKKAMGKLRTPDNLIEEISLHRFSPLQINFEHAQLAGELPGIHKDPFDRMLIAQAIIEELTLITRDNLIPKYDVNVIKA